MFDDRRAHSYQGIIVPRLHMANQDASNLRHPNPCWFGILFEIFRISEWEKLVKFPFQDVTLCNLLVAKAIAQKVNGGFGALGRLVLGEALGKPLGGCCCPSW